MSLRVTLPRGEELIKEKEEWLTTEFLPTAKIIAKHYSEIEKESSNESFRLGGTFIEAVKRGVSPFAFWYENKILYKTRQERAESVNKENKKIDKGTPTKEVESPPKTASEPSKPSVVDIEEWKHFDKDNEIVAYYGKIAEVDTKIAQNKEGKWYIAQKEAGEWTPKGNAAIDTENFKANIRWN